MPRIRWTPPVAAQAARDWPAEVVVGERLVSLPANRAVSGTYVEPGEVTAINTRIAAKIAGSTASGSTNQD